MSGEVRNIRLVLEVRRDSLSRGFRLRTTRHFPPSRESWKQPLKLFATSGCASCGAGRTDAGVHAGAGGPIFTPDHCPHRPLSRSPQQRAARGHPVKAADEVPLDFHARFDAAAKTYIYLVDNRPRPSVFLRNYACHESQPLNVEEMRRAAELLIGTQDYASFRTSGSSAKTTVRTVYQFEIAESKICPGMVKFKARADGFLYNMMRNMVGTLLEVGLGKLSAEDVKDILAARDRRRAGPTAPPHGLYLAGVEYPQSKQSTSPGRPFPRSRLRHPVGIIKEMSSILKDMHLWENNIL